MIESCHVTQTYQVQVMQPLMLQEGTERFPVLYLTDGNLSFDFCKGIAHCLQSTGRVARFILVGIGYPGESPFAGDLLRCRDLTPADRPEIAGIPDDSPIAGVSGFGASKKWGGAAQFLSFIEHELIPLVDATYPTIPGERGYFGHSLGGAFGLHVLFSHSPLFMKYILSSPGICHAGDEYGLKEAHRYIASESARQAALFMSVGDQEEFEPDFERSMLVSSFYRLSALLRKAHLQQLELHTRVFQGETHLGVWPVAFSHGIQALYRAEQPEASSRP